MQAGDRVAQLILEEVEMVECREVDSLDDTERGTGGFGSTGGSASLESAVPADTKELHVSGCMAGRPEQGVLKVHRRLSSAILPARGSAQAAGFDLAAAEPVNVPAGGKAIVKTGLGVAIPEGTYARIAPRSGLAAKKMIGVGAGVVDFDYRGDVGVVLFNHGSEDFAVQAGERIAQLILEKIVMAPCVEVDSLDDTTRGDGGFGSTGISAATPPPQKRLEQDPSLITFEKVVDAGA